MLISTAAIQRWTPPKFSGCAFWFDRGPGVTTAAGQTITWTDRVAALAITQPVAGNRPTYNINDANFGGRSSSQFAAAASTALNRAATNLFGAGAFSLFMRLKYDIIPATQVLLLSNTAATGDGFALGNSAVTGLRRLAVLGIANRDDAAATLNPETWALTYDGAGDAHLYVNGADQALSGAGSILAPAPGATLSFGSYNGGAASFFDGRYSEVFGYSRVVSSYERSVGTQYLSQF